MKVLQFKMLGSIYWYRFWTYLVVFLASFGKFSAIYKIKKFFQIQKIRGARQKSKFQSTLSSTEIEYVQGAQKASE